MGRRNPRRIACAEILEGRRLLSHPAADFNAITDPPVYSKLGGTAVMDAAATYPLSDCPQLSSSPGAPATLYLDFTGDTTTSWLSYTPGATPAYDTDGDPTTFSSTELANITAIWEQVSDTYSPFNINVTTVNPGSISNPNMEIVIGGAGGWSGGTYGGVAYIGSFAGSVATYGPNKNKAFVFPANLSPTSSSNARYVADDAEHEAGHAFGLNHQSVWTENTTLTPPTWSLKSEYNPGSSEAGPIMGNPLSDTRAMWWDGTTDYIGTGGSPQMQDDLSIISSSANRFGYRADDYGDSAAAAYPLAGTTSFSANGIIGSNSDQDFFAFTVYAGSTTINVLPGAPLSDSHPTLNANLQLFDSSGTLLAAGAQTTLAKSITTTLTAGTYYVDVSGDGTYGDLGDYTLNITAPSLLPDRFEPNNSFAQAADLGPTVTQTQSDISVDTSGNDDYFSFMPVDNGKLDANITFSNMAGNLDLYLYDQNQNLLASSLNTTANEQDVTASVIGGEKYYLRVAGANGATNPDYTLNISAPSPGWLSNVGNLNYTFGGTSTSPTLSINMGTGALTADASSYLNNLSVTVVYGASLQIQTTQHLASLVVNGSAAEAAGSNSTLVTNSLQLASTSTLDLADNSIQLNNGTLANVAAMIGSAYDAGLWNRPGLTSSLTPTTPGYGLGYSSAVVPGAVIVKFTRYGDVNLDGSVNSDDLSLLNAASKGSPAYWQDGDFNYDQQITADDFLRLSLSLAYQSAG